MIIIASVLISRLRSKYSVDYYNLSPQEQFSDIRLLSEGKPEKPEPEHIYICEYRDLRSIDREDQQTCILCITPVSSTPDSMFYSQRPMILVYSNSATRVLMEISRITYECGNLSSPMLDISQQLTGCRTINELLEQSFAFLENPLIVTDTTQKIIANTPVSKVGKSKYAEVISARYVPVGHASMDTDSSYKDVKNSPYTDVGSLGLPTVICRELQVGGRTVGFLHILQLMRDFRAADTYTIELLSNLLSVIMWKEQDRLTGSAADPAVQLLQEILNDSFARDEQVFARQKAVGLKSRKFVATVMVKARRGGLSPIISLSDVAQQLASMLPDTIGFIYRDAIVLYRTADEQRTLSGAALEPICPILEHYQLIAGVSNCYSLITQLREASYQSHLALIFGQRLSEDIVYQYRDYAVYHLIEIGLAREPIENFCAPEILNLIHYCENNDNTLLDTLKVYLQCGGNRTDAAQKLFIHLNTLKYRIGQIEKITGLSLKDNSTLIELNMTLKIIDYGEKFVGPQLKTPPIPPVHS